LFRSSPIAPITLLAILLATAAPGLSAAEEFDARGPIKEAMAAARDVPQQAEALVELAWGEATSDPRVRAAARQELVNFGHYSLAAVRGAIKSIDSIYCADATLTLIQARRQQREGNPPNFLPGMEEAIWFGSIEARRIAMTEIVRFHYPPAVLSMIDAIHIDPELTLHGLRALGWMGDERARFFLTRVLEHAEPRFKLAAATALGRLGETGLATLRVSARDEEQSVRESSMDALLRYTNPDDLTMLHEYVALRSDDDPAVVDRTRERAMELEALLEERQRSESASADAVPDPDSER